MAENMFKSFLGSFTQGLGGSLAGSLVGGVTSAISARNNRKWNEKMMNKQNEFNAEQAEIARQFNADEAQKTRDFNQQMDSTKYQRQVQDMQNAGVNPALAMNGGVSTQASSNATASSPMASSGSYGNAPLDLSSVAQLAMQAKQLDIQSKLAKSQERKNNAEAEGQEISNSYADEFNFLRNKGQELMNSLTTEQQKEITHRIGQIDETVNLLKKQAATEEERRNLTMAETALKRSMKDKTDAERQQIVELLPFQKEMMEAQTENQKAQAALNYINAAYQKGILDSGYIDDMARKMKAEADTAEAFSATNKVTQKIKSGDLSGYIDDVVSEFKSGNIGSGVMKLVIGAGQSLSTIVDSLIPEKLRLSGGANVSTSSSTTQSTSRSVAKVVK